MSAVLARMVIPDLRCCFDPVYYLDRYPDVRRSGMDPLAHFLWIDIPMSGGREWIPLAHFLLHGGWEGPQPDPFSMLPCRDERPTVWLPFKLPTQSYQVATSKAGIIDIVIRVYAGLEDTGKCLTSILRAVCQTAYESHSDQ
jgi:hypothetical protein